MNQTEVLSAPAADTVTETLAECRAATVPALRTVVEALHPRLARISAYHLGWCRPDGTPADGHAGKMLRAALAMLAARAFGASTASAVPGAVAAELVHNFSLLHDDLMDADELRRGRSTAWVVFGRGPAVLAGDALLSQALRVVTEVRGTAGQPATEVMTSAVDAIIQGQAADLELDGLPVDDVDTDDYLTACAKTSGLLGGCLEVGAVLAHAPAPAARMLRSAAWDLGVAWQIADDIESLWGDPAASGKDSYGDLRSGKRTYPVIAALRSETAAGSRLAARLSATETPAEDELAALAGLVEEAGGRAAAERAARRYLDRALHSLSRAGGESGAVDILTALFRHVLARHERWITRVPTAPATKGAAR